MHYQLNANARYYLVGIDLAMYETGMSILNINGKVFKFVLFTTHIKKYKDRDQDIDICFISYNKEKDPVKKGIVLGTALTRYLIWNRILNISLCFEDDAHGSFRSNRFGAFTGSVKSILYRAFPIAPIHTNPITSIKKFATGKGTASKSAMIRKFVQYNNIDPVTDDVADSFFIALYNVNKYSDRVCDE